MQERRDRRFLWAALALCLIGVGLMIGDRVAHADIANRKTFDALQLAFSGIALVTGALVVRSIRRRRLEAEREVVDLRERLGDLVDVDDTVVMRELEAAR
jgi:hypothetical protein